MRLRVTFVPFPLISPAAVGHDHKLLILFAYVVRPDINFFLVAFYVLIGV